MAQCLIQLVLLCFVFVAWSALAQPDSEKGSENQKQQTEAPQSKTEPDKNGAILPPILITVSPSLVNKQEPADKAPQEKHESTWEALTGVATAALAVITGTLAYFTFMLWRSTGDLVRGAERATRLALRTEGTHVSWGYCAEGNDEDRQSPWDKTTQMNTGLSKTS